MSEPAMTSSQITRIEEKRQKARGNTTLRVEVARMNEVLAEFLAEAEEMLHIHRSSLKEVSGTDSVLREQLHQAYRAIHTIHGGSGFLALHSLEHLSRHWEALLWTLEEEGRPPSEDEAALLRRLDEACTQILERLMRDGHEGPPPGILKGLDDAVVDAKDTRRNRDA